MLIMLNLLSIESKHFIKQLAWNLIMLNYFETVKRYYVNLNIVN